MKKYFLFFILIYLFVSQSVHAEVLSMTGFIPGQIWYSKDPFVEGDNIKIYTAIWNNGPSSLSAKVEFYDKNVLLGTRDVVVPASKLGEASVSWKVTSGDHLISAKIISPSTTLSGKKEIVSISRSTTTSDQRFVPILLNTVDGSPATGSDIIKSQFDKASSSLENIVPESISAPISENLGFVETARTGLLQNIIKSKVETQKKIDSFAPDATSLPLNNKKALDKVQVVDKSSGTSNSTDKPIAYIRLFFLSVLSFVFGSKLVFYLVGIFLIFLLIRFIYRKIANT